MSQYGSHWDDQDNQYFSCDQNPGQNDKSVQKITLQAGETKNITVGRNYPMNSTAPYDRCGSVQLDWGIIDVTEYKPSGYVTNSGVSCNLARPSDGMTVSAMCTTGKSCTQVVTKPNLIIQKQGNASSAKAGDTIEYTVKISNIGNASTNGTITVLEAPVQGEYYTYQSLVAGTGWTCTKYDPNPPNNPNHRVVCTTTKQYVPSINVWDTVVKVYVKINDNAPVNHTIVDHARIIDSTDTTDGDTTDWACDADLEGDNDSNNDNNQDNCDGWTLTITQTPINAVCGSANGGTGTCGTSIPTGDLCNPGNAGSETISYPQNGGTVSWTCSGTNGGTSANCSASCLKPPTPVNGVCGSANGTSGSCSRTLTPLCAQGTANPANPTFSNGTVSWTCSGTNGGTSANCSASCSNPVSSSTPTSTPATSSTTSTPVAQYPNLIIQKTSDTNVTTGGQVSYQLKVLNVGQVATNSPIVVTENLPSTLTFVSASGTNWNCSNVGNDITCTRSQALGVNQNSIITVVANINTGFIGNISNVASVSGGGEIDTTDINCDVVSNPINTVNNYDNYDNCDGWNIDVVSTPVDGLCGGANGSVGSCSRALYDLCQKGVSSNISTFNNGTANWSCNGVNGGLSVNCSASCTDITSMSSSVSSEVSTSSMSDTRSSLLTSLASSVNITSSSTLPNSAITDSSKKGFVFFVVGLIFVLSIVTKMNLHTLKKDIQFIEKVERSN
ncbi:hypothetical protein IPJ91_03210 [bacterium]|nr:MAG: hypothetical protein IPJ91_03210 [bacterium]